MPEDTVKPGERVITINDKPATRGRPKGSTNRPTGTAPKSQKGSAPAADVRQAMATLDSAYNVIAVGLAMFGLVETGNEWAARVDTLKATNQESLTAAPKLAKMLANVGGVGGTGAFLMAHAMAFAPVAAAARIELAAKAEARERTRPKRQPVDVIPDAPQTADPTLIPGLPVPGGSVLANG